MLNLSSLFFTAVDGDSCLHNNLNLTPAQRDTIGGARADVRNCLRKGIPQVLREHGYTDDVPEPRFFTQGSWAYKTLNSPARSPQQSDVDDGCYLPLSFVTQTKRPSKASSIFFAAAEEALLPLIKEKGWLLVKDKPTCIRVVITAYAHIDIPLYAIPDEEFMTLAKSMRQYGFDSLTAALKAEHDAWTALPSDKVLLAHREYDWKPSDPRPVKTWFLAEVEAKGEQFRRVVRYLKAIRDWKWANGGPPSILLMVAASLEFEKHDRRDDLALLHVVAKLPNRLRMGVENPIDRSESLTKRLGKEGVEEAAKAFEAFEKILRQSINASNASEACDTMREELGPRFPRDPARIVSVTVAATISAAPAIAGPSEIVDRSKAG